LGYYDGGSAISPAFFDIVVEKEGEVSTAKKSQNSNSNVQPSTNCANNNGERENPLNAVQKLQKQK